MKSMKFILGIIFAFLMGLYPLMAQKPIIPDLLYDMTDTVIENDESYKIMDDKVHGDDLFWYAKTNKRFLLLKIPLTDYDNDNFSVVEYFQFSKAALLPTYISSYFYYLEYPPKEDTWKPRY